MVVAVHKLVHGAVEDADEVQRLSLVVPVRALAQPHGVSDGVHRG